jgi:cGMP-dependent protein kinase 2
MVVSGVAEVIHINAQRLITFAENNEDQGRQGKSRAGNHRFSSLFGLSSQQPTAEQGPKEVPQLSLNDLEELQSLGEGTFGTVSLVRVRSINKYFAMKRIQMSRVEDAGQRALIEREKAAMQAINSPFVCKLQGVASDDGSSYLFLEYLCGGELWSVLYDPDTPPLPQGKFGGITQEHAVLYAGMVILAVEHVHMSGFVYRDLKPENLMISAQGYLKIVDFGFTKMLPYIGPNGGIEDRTYTLCGTPDYM